MFSTLKAIARTLCRVGPTALVIGLSAGCSLSAQNALGPPTAEGVFGTTKVPVERMPTDITTAPPVPWSGQDVLTVLAYADHVRLLQGDDLAKEIRHLGTSTAPVDQLRLGLALSQTSQLYDLVRAQELLQRVLSDTRADAQPLQTLARLLAARFTEQRRVEDLLDRQSLQLRELQRRLEQTQDKLEALKEIERSLSRRSSPVPLSSARSHSRHPNP